MKNFLKMISEIVVAILSSLVETISLLLLRLSPVRFVLMLVIIVGSFPILLILSIPMIVIFFVIQLIELIGMEIGNWKLERKLKKLKKSQKTELDKVIKS